MAEMTLIEKMRECNGRLKRDGEAGWRLITSTLVDVGGVEEAEVDALVEAGELVLSRDGAIIPQG